MPKGITVEIERLKAQIEALNRVREEFNERFVTMSERIGELRSMIIDNEKEYKDIKLSTQRAADLVEEVHPENLLKELKKEDAKIQVMNIKLESNEILLNKIIDDLKDMRRTVSEFRGIERITELSKEIKEDIRSAKQIKTGIEKHADKVEDIFVYSMKRYEKFRKLDSSVDNLQKEFKSFIKEFNKQLVEFTGLAKKKDLYKIKTEIENRYKDIELNLKQKFIRDSKEFVRMNNSIKREINKNKIINEKLKKSKLKMEEKVNKMSKGNKIELKLLKNETRELRKC